MKYLKMSVISVLITIFGLIIFYQFGSKTPLEALYKSSEGRYEISNIITSSKINDKSSVFFLTKSNHVGVMLIEKTLFGWKYPTFQVAAKPYTEIESSKLMSNVYILNEIITETHSKLCMALFHLLV